MPVPLGPQTASRPHVKFFQRPKLNDFHACGESGRRFAYDISA
jgi:hypothetical protein